MVATDARAAPGRQALCSAQQQGTEDPAARAEGVEPEMDLPTPQPSLLSITGTDQAQFAVIRKEAGMEVRFPVDADERTSALQLASDAYMSRGYVKDLPPLGGDSTHLLVAVSDGRVIGTVSAVIRSDKALPTEEYYGLSNLDERSGMVMEVGRLAVGDGTGSSRAMTLIGLLAAVVLLGDRNGVKLVLATLKPALRRRLAMLGINSELVAGPSMLTPAAVSPEYWGYFFPQPATQRPVAVVFSLDQARVPILGHLPAASGHITICTELASSSPSCAA